MTATEELFHCMLLNRVTNCTTGQKYVLYERYGSAEAIFKRRHEAERALKKELAVNGKPLSAEGAKGSVEEEFAWYMKHGVHLIDLSSPLYPERLRSICDPPLILFVEGNTALLKEELAIGIVGSRKASNAGITMAYSTARELSKAGVVVVSGLAAGIDFYAHRGALEGKGSTIAVLGNGVDVVYPKGNEELYERIKKEGCLVTEFPLGTAPLKQNFPRRNRIISGMSAGTAVVEAGESSGALITAMHALEQGREVMAFPGRAGSECFSGNNRLIKEGAHLVEDASDILRIFGKEIVSRPLGARGAFSPLGKDILRVIGDEMTSIERIEQLLQRPVSAIASELMLLELRGAIQQHPGKIYSRVYTHGY